MEFKQQLVESIAKKQKDSRTGMFVHAGFIGLGIGVSIAASVLFPPVGIPALVSQVALIVAAINGFELLRPVGKYSGYEKAKAEAASGDGKMPQTAEREKKHAKVDAHAGLVTLGAMAVLVGSVVTMGLFPAALPVATAIFQMTLGVGVTAMGISRWHGGVAKFSENALKAAKELAAAPASASEVPEAPAAPKKSRSLFSIFKRSATNDAKPEPAKPAPAPAAPSAPKP